MIKLCWTLFMSGHGYVLLRCRSATVFGNIKGKAKWTTYP